jgi:hypothetical protein
VRRTLVILGILSASVMPAKSAWSTGLPAIQHKVLATKKTSTMEKELNQAGMEGFKFQGVMGGETGWAGSEAVCILSREMSEAKKPAFEYKLLATSKTSTMQKEIQQAADLGFCYRGQTIFESTFGGKEVVIIMEREMDASLTRFEYKLLATSRTSTMQKELQALGDVGFEMVGMTVAETAFGGKEIVTILKRPASK